MDSGTDLRNRLDCVIQFLFGDTQKFSNVIVNLFHCRHGQELFGVGNSESREFVNKLRTYAAVALLQGPSQGSRSRAFRGWIRRRRGISSRDRFPPV